LLHVALRWGIVGSKRDEFEESTKVRSAAEIDEMLRSTSAESAEPHEDFEHDAHTKVGNIDELVAQTRARTADPTVRPGAARNVVRRASSPVIGASVGRNTPSLGVTRATGSQSEIEPADAKTKSDDAAFDEMQIDEAPPERTSERTFGEKAMPLALPAPPVSAQMPVAKKLPDAPRSQSVRWGVVAWFALLAIMIGVGSVGYIRIKQLEDQLAAAKTKLERK
jgi:hypothetical protein